MLPALAAAGAARAAPRVAAAAGLPSAAAAATAAAGGALPSALGGALPGATTLSVRFDSTRRKRAKAMNKHR
jgi:hypothetical protein